MSTRIGFDRLFSVFLVLALAPAAWSQTVCPAPGELVSEALMSRDELWSLQEQMVDVGLRFTGSPAHKAWLDIIETELIGDGLSVERHPGAMKRWDHTSWSLKLIEDDVETDVPVASFYPYSGSTPPGGVVGELADAGDGLPLNFQLGDFTGKIAVVHEVVAPLTVGSLIYPVLTYQHDPDLTLTAASDYKRAWTTILNPQNSVVTRDTGSLYAAHAAGAAAVIIALDLDAENAAGQYTPLSWDPEGREMPALFVDRATGQLLDEKIAAGASARLELQVTEYPDDSVDELIATLPGVDPNELILITSHTDGPSASEENGNVGQIALAHYFASLPIECRQRTLVFVFEPDHFHHDVQVEHSKQELIDAAVASVTIEHLGQEEWADDELGYHPTGYYEPGVFFCSETPITQLAIDSVIEEDLRRVVIARPYAGYIYFGVGAPLHQAGVPNCSYISGPNALLSWADNQHLNKTDPDRIEREVRASIRLTSRIDATDATVLSAGDTLVFDPPDVPPPPLPGVCQNGRGTETTHVAGPIAAQTPGDPTRNYPWSATDIDLAAHGYVEEEFFFCGTTSGGDYTTRMIVRRPAAAEDFSGVTAVEWLNVTRGYDIEALWLLSSDEILREGHAYVGVSAQRASIYDVDQGLKAWSPVRYNELDIPLGGDVFLFVFDPVAYEIYDQALRAVKTPTGNAPLGPLSTDTLIASGASQSAGTMIFYYDQFQAVSDVADGYLSFLLSSSSLENVFESPFTANTQLSVPSDSVGTPFFQVNTEHDPSFVRPQPDTDTYRLWEVAGASHVDEDGMERQQPIFMRDFGVDLRAGDDACPFTPRSRIPYRYALNAALHHTVDWVRNGTPPPITDPYEYDLLGRIARDVPGNALGGLRLAEHEVPTAVNRPENEGCPLQGRHVPFDEVTLLSLYPTHDAYVQQHAAAVQQNLAAGTILAPDAAESNQRAQEAPIPAEIPDPLPEPGAFGGLLVGALALLLLRRCT